MIHGKQNNKEVNFMENQKDLFEDIRKIVGCVFISDLRFKKEQVLKVIEILPLMEYTDRQKKDFCEYIFGIHIEYSKFK